MLYLGDPLESDAPLRRPLVDRLHDPRAAWFIFVVSLALTGFGWYLSNSYLANRALDRFGFDVEEADFAIRERMRVFEQLLRGGVGLFEASRNVTRSNWRSYVTNLDIDRHFAGV
ncbi:MAG: hypothetical protein EXR39_00795 [Betaproteobacteria bacterium]|nr:hypothetical protein [Betaproteobacteria bacterium]